MDGYSDGSERARERRSESDCKITKQLAQSSGDLAVRDQLKRTTPRKIRTREKYVA